jgi:hypothetical protein
LAKMSCSCTAATTGHKDKTAHRVSARRQGIHVRPRATGASGATVRFADGSHSASTRSSGRPALSWTTHSYSYPCSRSVAASGTSAEPPTCQAGTSLGLTWRHARASALLGWIEHDAEYMRDGVGALARSRSSAARPRRDSGLSGVMSVPGRRRRTRSCARTSPASTARSRGHLTRRMCRCQELDEVGRTRRREQGVANAAGQLLRARGTNV